MNPLRALIREVPDFPLPGISFKDIAPLLASPTEFKAALEAMAIPFRGRGVTLVAGLDARGFIFGPGVAQLLGVGFTMIRKCGKLPGGVQKIDYTLEYGVASLEIQSDLLQKTDRVLLVDDVIATGGTLIAASQLIQKSGATVVGISALIGLRYLGDYQAKLLAQIPDALIRAAIEYT